MEFSNGGVSLHGRNDGSEFILSTVYGLTAVAASERRDAGISGSKSMVGTELLKYVR